MDDVPDGKVVRSRAHRAAARSAELREWLERLRAAQVQPGRVGARRPSGERAERAERVA